MPAKNSRGDARGKFQFAPVRLVLLPPEACVSIGRKAKAGRVICFAGWARFRASFSVVRATLEHLLFLLGFLLKQLLSIRAREKGHAPAARARFHPASLNSNFRYPDFRAELPASVHRGRSRP